MCKKILVVSLCLISCFAVLAFSASAALTTGDNWVANTGAGGSTLEFVDVSGSFSDFDFDSADAFTFSDSANFLGLTFTSVDSYDLDIGDVVSFSFLYYYDFLDNDDFEPFTVAIGDTVIDSDPDRIDGYYDYPAYLYNIRYVVTDPVEDVHIVLSSSVGPSSPVSSYIVFRISDVKVSSSNYMAETGTFLGSILDTMGTVLGFMISNPLLIVTLCIVFVSLAIGFIRRFLNTRS